MIEKSEFFAKVERIFAQNALEAYITAEICEKFYALTNKMLETNEKMNITAIKDIDSIISLHFADSLMLLSAGIEEGTKILDVGCGGGFPSFPIAIARPDIKVVGIDSTAKKVNYINETAKEIGIDNLVAITGRAEDFCTKENARESFDVVCARAVAALPILSELCLPFVKKDGRFIALKSKTAEEEIEASRGGIKKLGGKIEKIEKTTLYIPNSEEAERNLIIIRKTDKTPPQYPRNYSQIKKKPLA